MDVFSQNETVAAGQSAAALRSRGLMSYLAGQSAEEQVAQHYEARGYDVLARRWRTRGGELDLILSRGGEIVFVEVKASRTHASALAHVTPAQVRRLVKTAEAYIASLGSIVPTDLRFDVATLDHMGTVEVLENIALFDYA